MLVGFMAQTRSPSLTRHPIVDLKTLFNSNRCWRSTCGTNGTCAQPANWSMGWHRHSPTMLPLSLGIGRTLVRPGLPPMSLFVTGQWMVYRQFAPISPQTTINFGLTVAFPQLMDFWYR